ncbi:MAG: hypothetical protein NC339_02585 [Muribaculaceae bacterium]|nr:hypothetical protein [Muribaculaceae bacterium]
MRKIFTLAIAVLALSANAESKSWNFTNWSAETVANLKASNAAGGNWSDIEKADATEPTAASKDKCFWQVNAAADVNADGYLMANGVVISELQGLVSTNETQNRSLAIAIDYVSPNPDDSFGPYKGGAYLWLGSKNIKYFMIPAVPAGATIKMGIESHKISDARGVKLTVEGVELTAPDGSAVAAPTTYVEQEWLAPNGGNVQITNTNGCHIYFINVVDPADTALETIAVDQNAAVEYFNLQGVRVENPANGLYIRRQGNEVSKVLVK